MHEPEGAILGELLEGLFKYLKVWWLSPRSRHPRVKSVSHSGEGIGAVRGRVAKRISAHDEAHRCPHCWFPMPPSSFCRQCGRS
jgi:hypothetical protein